MKSSDVVEKVGILELGGHAFRIAKLVVEREAELWRHLELEARKARGPGGLFSRMAPKLKWLRENGMGAEWTEAVQVITNLEAGNFKASEDEIFDFRRTPAGVAIEMWHRCRDAHPGTTLDEIRAVLTEVNAPDVYRRVQEIVRGDDPKATPSASTGG